METVNGLRQKLSDFIEKNKGKISLSDEYVVSVALETELKIEKLLINSWMYPPRLKALEDIFYKKIDFFW